MLFEESEKKFIEKIKPEINNFFKPDENIEDLIDFMDYARDAHQNFVDYPEKQTDTSGDTEWNIEVVEYYKQVLEILSK